MAIYYRFKYKGAAEAYSEAGGTDSTGRVQARLLSLREKAEKALDARSLPPSSAGSVRSSHDWLCLVWFPRLSSGDGTRTRIPHRSRISS